MSFVGQISRQVIANGDKFLFADLNCSLFLWLFNARIVKFESKPY